MLDHWFYGFDPGGYHLTNVLLHAVNTVLVFGILRRLTGSTWRSLSVAILFGLHPLRVESVAWISERKDMFSLMFWMLALWAYARFVQERSNAGRRAARAATGHLLSDRRFATFYYLLALLFFALALMSKPMVVTLPFVLLLLDYWPLNRWREWRFPQLLAEKTPFFLLSAIVMLATYYGQKSAGMMDPDFTGLSLSFDERLANAMVSYARYLGKLFLPVNLCALYPYPVHWPLAAVLLAGLLVLGLSFLFFALRHEQPYLLIGWLWFLGTLVPVLGLVSVGVQAMADRYLYIPSIGILTALVWGICRMTGGWRFQRVGLGAIGCLLALVCIGLTRRQITYWKDDVSVWQHAVAVTRRNFEAHNRLGSAWYFIGQFPAAASEFQITTELNPTFAQAWCNLSRALAAQNRMDDAVAACQKALQIRPRFVAAHNSLSLFLQKMGRHDEAMLHCRLAVEIDPDSVNSQFNLGMALALEGKFEEAATHYQKALAVDPRNPLTHVYLGSALAHAGRLDDAIHHFRLALKLQPDNPLGHNYLGGTLLAKGQVSEAVSEFRQATELQPKQLEFRRSLGHALLNQGSLDEAIAVFQQAFALWPGNATASNDLALALELKSKSAMFPTNSAKP